MIFFPAIDLKDGRCVRLLRGDMAAATVFAEDPAAQARAFARAGCDWLHVVDLNGAFAGHPVNGEAVDGIVCAVDVPIQLGGGIRDMGTVARWLDGGVRRVVLGTAAVSDPKLVRRACRRYPGRVAVAIDVRDGLVAIEGWAKATRMQALDLARRFEDAGVAAVVYTDVGRDGALEGPNVEAAVALARSIAIPVIASGGIASMADLEAIATAGADILEGVISGRALYDGRIDPSAAARLLRAAAE